MKTDINPLWIVKLIRKIGSDRYSYVGLCIYGSFFSFLYSSHFTALKSLKGVSICALLSGVLIGLAVLILLLGRNKKQPPSTDPERVVQLEKEVKELKGKIIRLTSKKSKGRAKSNYNQLAVDRPSNEVSINTHFGTEYNFSYENTIKIVEDYKDEGLEAFTFTNDQSKNANKVSELLTTDNHSCYSRMCLQHFGSTTFSLN